MHFLSRRKLPDERARAGQAQEQQAEQQAEPSKKEGDSKDNVVDAEYEDVTK